MTWCPKMIKIKEGRFFNFDDHIENPEGVDPLREAINTPNYRGSLKHNFFEKESITPDIEDDKLQMRAKKPLFKRIDKSLSLNFDGRVKKASRKNIQIVRI